MIRRIIATSLLLIFYQVADICRLQAQDDAGEPAATEHDPLDPMRAMQSRAIREQKSDWGHWGHVPKRFSTWIQHSNRLVPIYTFGLTLDALRAEGSVYSNPQRLEKLYGRVPDGTVNPTAVYFDQTDVHRLQQAAVDAGCRNIILMIFDGMDWQTTRAAAIYNTGKVGYERGRGTGLSILDERRTHTDFGLLCTSPKLSGAKFDVNSQTVLDAGKESTGGYDPLRGGRDPWHEQSQRDYLLGLDREQPHSVTDSAAGATSMTSGIKTYYGAVNMTVDGQHVLPIARQLQDQQGFLVGVVTNVPVSHATPAAAYANNVSRKDYQDIARDLIGLPSSSHRDQPLSGVDVLIGGGWGEGAGEDKSQGNNFLAGNKYLHQNDMNKVDLSNGGRFVVAQRTAGKSGRLELLRAARRAADERHRLLGFFGTKGGHLPFRTADGRFDPTYDIKGTERYSQADVQENPTLAEMTEAALMVLERAVNGFWVMVEAGDVDWANHANNLDNSIGAVLSGDEAFRVVTHWIEEHDAWSYTAVIVTADHGHYLVIDDAHVIANAGREARDRSRKASN